MPVTVRIISDFITAGLAIAGINVTENTMKIEGKDPMSVMNAMIELDMDWEIDFTDATDAEYLIWRQADYIGRVVRAEKKGKTILLEGTPLGYDEVMDAVVSFVQQHGHLPDTLEDNSMSLVFGIREEPEEDTGE
jgi:hypothetical protein